MTITFASGFAKIKTPYNSDFVAKIKRIGGRKWNAEEKCWMVPETEVETVRNYMMEVFGETDLTGDSEKVTVRVEFTEDAIADRDAVVIFGKTIARAYGRDTGARVGDEATFEIGEPRSGGSRSNWTTVIPAGCVVKVRNVARAALEAARMDGIEVEVFDESRIDRTALEAEKARLIARLAEIEALLAQ